MNCFGAVLFGSTVLLPFAALPAEALSLKEALETAYTTNPQIEVARANLRATD